MHAGIFGLSPACLSWLAVEFFGSTRTVDALGKRPRYTFFLFTFIKYHIHMTQELILKGTGASAGVAHGKVQIVAGIKDAATFEEGSILVTRITDPSMVMMMAKSAAIVCDIGGLTSHPSIVSREMGIPCVVNTKTATSTLKYGQEIIVDGTKGEIYATE